MQLWKATERGKHVQCFQGPGNPTGAGSIERKKIQKVPYMGEKGHHYRPHSYGMKTSVTGLAREAPKALETKKAVAAAVRCKSLWLKTPRMNA